MSMESGCPVVGEFVRSSRFWVTVSSVIDKFTDVKRQQIDRDREDRIEIEIVVDAYDESERAMGLVLLSGGCSEISISGQMY